MVQNVALLLRVKTGQTMKFTQFCFLCLSAIRLRRLSDVIALSCLQVVAVYIFPRVHSYCLWVGWSGRRNVLLADVEASQSLSFSIV